MLTLEHALLKQRIVERLWRRDASLWHPSAETQAGISRRLGWLDAPDGALLTQVRSIAAAVSRPAVLLTPGDAGNAARLWLGSGTAALAERRGGWVLLADRVSPALDELLATAGHASEAGLIAVAPPSVLASLPGRSHELAANPNAGARFGALGSYGLVAAALAGRDLEAISTGARTALEACRVDEEFNPGVRLGALLAALAQHGYDVLYLRAAPSMRRVADWLAGLLAGALSKHGRGFVPIIVAPAWHTPAQRVASIVLRAPRSTPDTIPPEPSIEFTLADDAEVGALAAVWQIGVAVAAVVLGVNPFDEPDTLVFEQRLRQISAGELQLEQPEVPLLDVSEPADLPLGARWLALVAYHSPHADKPGALDLLRSRLEQRSGRPVALVEPPRHAWATQLLHAGRPDGFALVLPPSPAASSLAKARFALDLDAWRRMGRGVARLRIS